MGCASWQAALRSVRQDAPHCRLWTHRHPNRQALSRHGDECPRLRSLQVDRGDQSCGWGGRKLSRCGAPRADFVSLHCPKTPETVGMFNAARLRRMKPSSYLINTARGGIIDEAALYDALSSGKLAGAGLDVFQQEPPAVPYPLSELPNVVVAPHVAGVTWEAVDRMSEQTARNILSVLDGEPIRQNVINQDVLG